MGCLGCGMFGMWDVRDVGCSGCGMFGMWDVGCEMFAGMWDVDLQNAMMFENMLSIRVCDLGVTVVGKEMYGRRKFSYIISRNVAESLFVSYLRISMLKSPIRITSLFS